MALLCILSGPSYGIIKSLTQIKDSGKDNSTYTKQHNDVAEESNSILTTITQKVSANTTEETPQDQNPGNFYIRIPKIKLKENITKNVNPVSKEIYLPVIEKSIAHGQYTALPDQVQGNTYLFAHSKNYYGNNTPEGGYFTRIDELRKKDKIYIFYNSESYTYEVVDYFIVESEQTDVYSADSPFLTKRSLTLQTCTPRGTTEKRLIVRAIEI